MDRVDLSVCSPNYNKKPHLKAFVDSVLTQDYPYIELIIVDDGSTDGSWKLLQQLEKQYSPRLKIFQQEHLGACQARNLAVSKIHPTTKYISHLPTDSVFYPGMARLWIKSLDENPSYGFLYGGYRFGPPINANFVAEPFDLEVLKVYNYIDGSFPYRKELFPKENNGGWDPDIKSLQDWDFWLAICLKGVQGLYMGEVFFETIPPQPKGLSYDSAQNWLERTQAIKKKWGIPLRTLCVTSAAGSHFAKYLAKILQADYNPNPNFKPNIYKMIYLLGFYPSLADRCVQALSFPGRKVIHWVGTDIFQMLEAIPRMKARELVNLFDIHGVIHLCEFKQTQEELKQIGINAEIVPIPPRKLFQVMPLPKTPTIAVYAPDINADLYNPGLVKAAAKLVPEVKFKFFGNPYQQGRDPEVKNIEYIGYVDNMEKFISECSALVRMTKHDGFPVTIGEFMSAGRNILFSIKIPHALWHNNSNAVDLAAKIRELVKLPVNEKGSKYYRRMLDQKRYHRKIAEIFSRDIYHPESYWEDRAFSWINQAPKMPDHKDVILPLLDELKVEKKSSVLDVGCGEGRWVRELAKRFKKYVGIDIAPTLVEHCRNKFPGKEFYTMKIEQMLHENLADAKKYDLLFCYNVLQHIKPTELTKAYEAMRLIGKKALIIEPTEFESAEYCFSHDYDKLFHVVKKIELPNERPGVDLGKTFAYVVDLEKE